MQLPAYWWLLALAVLVQGAFFVRHGVLRLRQNAVQPLSRPGLILLGVSGVAGLAYGAVQSDPLFFLGQMCLFVIYHRLQRVNHDD